MKMTIHGQCRMQQRAVPGLIVSLLLDHGASSWQHGAEMRFIDRTARQKIKRELGGDRSLSIIDRWLNVYLVVASDGQIITVGRRTGRLKHG
jgi:hypothetical protein